ncbi:hypothetical protein [Lentzea indica]|nr:hypothetical protein [Lentzea indica]
MTTLNSGTQFSFDLLAGALTRRDEGATGTLHVTGNPGGRIHLRDGGVICVESAGAPGPDLVSRTGRIETELHLIAMMATHDAAFTMVAGDIEDCAFTTRTFNTAVVMSAAIEPVRLLQEASRRMTALLALKHPLCPHRERVAPAPGSTQGDPGSLREEILTHATGGHTTRDIAFASSRSVYPVTIEACRMVADGLMTVVPGTSPAGEDVPLPRSLRRHALPKPFQSG